MVLHQWQARELVRLAHDGDGNEYDASAPYKCAICAANGSGKDEVIIATFVVWLALTGFKNRAVVTTSSEQQLKTQTAPHIAFAVGRCNQLFNNCFQSTQRQHFCTTTGSQIVMFVTNEPGRAEGYHPWGNGKLALIINEGKTVDDTIYESFYRCTGYTHMLFISSPAGRSGHFYRTCIAADQYPKENRPGHFFFRRISAYDCPHIPLTHLEDMKNKMSEWWFKSSVLAEFSDIEDQSVIIPEYLLNDLWRNPCAVTGEDIGIGSDYGAGKDENVIYVRRGNKLLAEFAFVSDDTTETADRIDRLLLPWKDGAYKFNADDNGIGKAIDDMLRKKGWRITPRFNQSAALNRRYYLNFGAESYFHAKTLIEHNAFSLDRKRYEHSKLIDQLTRRRCEQLGTGKYRLEKKSIAKSRDRWSPDRADAFVLCFWSLRPRGLSTPEQKTQPFEGKPLGVILKELRRGIYDKRISGQSNRWPCCIAKGL